jgi:ATP synthase F1 delta subunit
VRDGPGRARRPRVCAAARSSHGVPPEGPPSHPSPAARLTAPPPPPRRRPPPPEPPAEILAAVEASELAAAAKVSAPLPVKLPAGRASEVVAALWTEAKAGKAPAFDKTVGELGKFVAAVEAAGANVDRMFSSSHYSADECGTAVALLLGTAPAPSAAAYASLDASVQDVIDDPAAVAQWLSARAAIADMKLSATTQGVLTQLAREANLARVKRVAARGAAVVAAQSKSAAVTVTSAVALTKAQQDAVAKALPKYVPGDAKDIKASFVVDASVLGGLTVAFGNSVVDLSAISRLTDLARGEAPA